MVVSISYKKTILEKINYRQINLDETSCIDCINSNNNLKISNKGSKEVKCCYLKMKVDENHTCDLIC